MSDVRDLIMMSCMYDDSNVCGCCVIVTGFERIQVGSNIGMLLNPYRELRAAPGVLVKSFILQRGKWVCF